MRNTTARMAGILMPVASLPSKDGIGSLGAQAYQFVDMLAQMGMKVWQILPLHPLGYGNSPYQPFSSYAGDELYIDLDELAEMGLLKKEREPHCGHGFAGCLEQPGGLSAGRGVPSQLCGRRSAGLFQRNGTALGQSNIQLGQSAKKGFTFWVNRFKYSNILYDIIRIDHFRAFDTYWKIPASCETAVDGEWLEAPGYALFDELYRQMPDIWIVAEDLGELRPEVLILRDHYDLCGMNVAEFSIPFPDQHKEHQLIYTGTHDNQTVRGWLQGLDR